MGWLASSARGAPPEIRGAGARVLARKASLPQSAMYGGVQGADGSPPASGTGRAAVGPAAGLRGTGEDAGGAHDVVAIAASLGGVEALSRVLAELPADFPLPILVVQHPRRGRPSASPGVLARRTALRVKAAEEGDRPAPDRVCVAPPDRHLLCGPGGALRLSPGAPVNSCRPSADVPFRSLADAHGPRAIAVVLTGTGRDGARGVEAVTGAGGVAIAQDEASAEAADMPRAAVDIGHADLVLPLDRIASALTVLAGRHGAGAAPVLPLGSGRPPRPRGSAGPLAPALRSLGRSSRPAF